MPSNTFRVGVASVQIPIDTNSALGSLSTLAYSVSSLTPSNYLLNDVNNPLPTATNMQVMLGLVGRDATNGGYTVGYCSPGSGILTVAAGNGIYINVPSANLAGISNISTAFAMAIFLKIGNANFQLAEFAYIDPAADFNHMIIAKPMLDAPFFATSLLQSTTVDTTLGNRAPLGYTFLTLSPTTGGVNVTRDVSEVTFKPDTGTDFSIPTARTASIAFELLSNAIFDVVRGNSGNAVTFTATGGQVITEAQMSLNTALVRVPGNKPMKMIMPPDQNGVQEIRLFLGQLVQNTQKNQEAWKKDAPVPISYTFSPCSIDRLITSQHTEIQYQSQ